MESPAPPLGGSIEGGRERSGSQVPRGGPGPSGESDHGTLGRAGVAANRLWRLVFCFGCCSLEITSFSLQSFSLKPATADTWGKAVESVGPPTALCGRRFVGPPQIFYSRPLVVGRTCGKLLYATFMPCSTLHQSLQAGSPVFLGLPLTVDHPERENSQPFGPVPPGGIGGGI